MLWTPPTETSAAGCHRPGVVDHWHRWSQAIDKDAVKMWRVALRYSALGLEMGAAISIGYAAGWWLDKTFGTKPYLTMVMLLFGIAAAFKAIYRVAKEYSSMNSEGDNK
jgi:ATP synthase protein I